MCDKDLLLGYLYDELTPTDRQAFDRHLTACAACRDEVVGLRGTRTDLMSWAPPEPDLGFEIVRSAKTVEVPARWWRRSPVWGLAAAAMITLAVSAAIANLEVKVGTDGVVVLTGWNRGDGGQVPAAPSASASDVQRVAAVEARLKELEGQLAARQAAVAVTASTVTGRMSDAEILRLMRQTVSDSEQRQQGELARRILQVNRDTESARRADMDRLLVAYRQLQGTNFETSQRQKALEEHFIRVGMQR
jgi:anti-sigma factor RsiW